MLVACQNGYLGRRIALVDSAAAALKVAARLEREHAHLSASRMFYLDQATYLHWQRLGKIPRGDVDEPLAYSSEGLVICDPPGSRSDSASAVR
jgi:hypothetical protein